jgi:hypothetical protein
MSEGMSTLTRLAQRPRARAVLSAGGTRIARVDEHALTRRTALRSLPRVLESRIVPAAAADLDCVYELRVTASAGGPERRFTLTVADGRGRVQSRPAPEADAWVALSLADMIRLVSGAAQLWPLVAEHRVSLGGEIFTVMRFPRLLGF